MAAHSPRIAEYHRRRHRLARRRRAPGRSRLRRSAAEIRLPAGAVCCAVDDELGDALRVLALRALAYRAVTGLLFRCRGDRVAVRVVAGRPMTAPLRVLSAAWREELGEAHPGIQWVVEVSDRAPDPALQYRCYYWGRH